MITATSKKTDYITELTNGRHFFYTDTPLSDGGSDLYQRPGDILASALAACTNITARKYLNRDGLSYDQVVVTVELDRADPAHPAFKAHIDIQGDLTAQQKQAIIAEVESCPVCQLLRAPATVTVD